MSTIQNVINRSIVGKSSNYGSLSIFPLLSEKVNLPGYQTLEEAMTDGLAQISEVSDSGAVPELLFRNNSHKPVLVIDGEELLGGKQNRVINLTILVPAKAEIKIPVSCVEAGRWHPSGGNFKDAGRTHFAKGRSAKTASVSNSMKYKRSHRADQGKVWSDISEKLKKTESYSSTSAMASAYDAREKDLDSYVKAFKAEQNQVGAVFVIDNEVKGAELFDSAVTFKKYFPKLIKSYALDAIEITEESSIAPNGEEINQFLSGVSDAKADNYPAIGLGKDLRINNSELSAGALENDGDIVHLVAFANTNLSKGYVWSRSEKIRKQSDKSGQ